MKKRKSNVKLAGGEGSTKVTEIASSSSRTKDNDGRKGKQVLSRKSHEEVKRGVSKDDTLQTSLNDEEDESSEPGESEDSDEDDSSDEEDSDDDEEEDEEDEEDDDSGDNDSDGDQQVINVDFEFFDPKPVDFHGLKGLLRTYLDETAWDLTSLVDTIIAQTTVGTVVKTGDDESPIGVASALNLHRHKSQAWAKDVAGFLRANAGQRPEATKLEALLAAVQQKKRQVGLIVSERVVNLPVELTPPLHQALFDEILWATEDEPTEERRESFKFAEYLILTRIYREVTPPPQKRKDKQPHKKAKREEEEGEGELLYIKPEDEVFHKLSSWSFTFPVHAEAQAARQSKKLRQLRLVMAVSAKQIPTFRARLKKLIEEGDGAA